MLFRRKSCSADRHNSYWPIKRNPVALLLRNTVLVNISTWHDKSISAWDVSLTCSSTTKEFQLLGSTPIFLSLLTLMYHDPKLKSVKYLRGVGSFISCWEGLKGLRRHIIKWYTSCSSFVISGAWEIKRITYLRIT